ncbi:MAG: hypothetical protein A2W93_10890 [Bacteroidetes bacterium GWF2_43_63]|nr:MAG: hypothetical protein A2W94_00250 [Bacteroidetes bacterium GWE2_42_42]OFY56420.1 MAG: hypothetical protein A2W93_10890 [Bacteroidetes bacterium GWF2_43_63]HBG72016.1 hypothetical protein [Bacteroidales bacterium]HCB63030.1 hypothetical protein [Bacteroidales bacterium]HCY23249.1 hypothetical protein [Bacteroidales bacterium]
MKKVHIRIIILTFLVLLIAIPAFMFLSWYFSPRKTLKVVILDKTVLNRKYQEHMSFFWVLRQNKYMKPDDTFYEPEKDYIGFFPDGNGGYTINDLEEKSREYLVQLADANDMVFYTDLYGIYRIEWLNEYPQAKPHMKPGRMGERSELIYGGMSQNELEFLRIMKNKKKLIINEFNTFASPTSPEIRKDYEEEFDITWTGWVGRYFDNLDTTNNKEIPLWLIRNYKDQNNGHWPFKKAGIAFVRNDDRIVILENETHLTNEVPHIVTGSVYAEYYNVAGEIKYPFWFDICRTGESNEMVSEYKIETNEKGASVLKQWEIPESFPAVLMNKDYPYYYLAGDFSDNPISISSSGFRFVQNFDFLFYPSEMLERSSFFWKFYRPMLEKILADYYNSLKK